ncbi:hypothetical protein dsx2_1548 [Desulfovibrio sp. X2]|uniref:hypothetical protein n=1 Tax=Desulfovibrio sp. X2 TaxID=941449 RepID=UPI000358793F|nr:hypothetical protein [Desulfovibrio sp. X2]EPR44589.1 hypothetical protein dsx2_1548 [Desulfovibrio sp. X2]
MTSEYTSLDSLIEDPGRRRFLGFGAAAGAVLAAAAVVPSAARAAAKAKAASLDECLSLSQQQMAARAPAVKQGMAYLRSAANTVRDAKARAVVTALLDDPVPSLAGPLADAGNRRAVYDELVGQGLLKDVAFEAFLPPVAEGGRASQPFMSSTGSGWTSHHAYPGGLVTHTAANLHISEAIYASYKDVYGFALDRDTVVVSQMLHDLHKPWVFQWEGSGACRTELSLAGTGEHHVLGVAESIVRGVPARMVVAQACAHNHPGSPADEAQVVGWLKAASIIVGVDPEKAGLLAPGGATLPLPRRMEGFVCHLGDHDWVFTVPAAKAMIAELGDLAKERYGIDDVSASSKHFNNFRNYVFSQATIESLYETYAVKGRAGFASAVAGVVRPA